MKDSKTPKPQYPASLFWSGVAVSILRSFLWLAVSTVLLLLGSTTPWCGWAGLALFFAVIAVAVGKQLVYRHTLLHMREPDMDDWRAATLSPDWAENVKAMVERAMNDDIELPEDFDEDHDDLDGGDGDRGESNGSRKN